MTLNIEKQAKSGVKNDPRCLWINCFLQNCAIVREPSQVKDFSVKLICFEVNATNRVKSSDLKISMTSSNNTTTLHVDSSKYNSKTTLDLSEKSDTVYALYWTKLC